VGDEANPVLRALGALKEGALDLLYPLRCIHCGSTGAIDKESCLCPVCLEAEEIFGDEEHVCPRCGLPIEHSADSVSTTACRFCEHSAFHFQYAASAGRYEGRLRSVIRGYKYEAKLQVKAHLAKLLSQAYGRSAFYDKAEIVAPVASSKSRVKARGYDPVAELAKAFAEAEGFKFIGDVITRKRDTRPLAGLSAKERHGEVMGAFAPVEGKTIDGAVILVDDIMTTGSTLDDAARAVKAAGAERVYALTVARDII
jgi:ComF family protein